MQAKKDENIRVVGTPTLLKDLTCAMGRRGPPSYSTHSAGHTPHLSVLDARLPMVILRGCLTITS